MNYSYSPCELFDAALLLMTNSALSLNFDVHIHLLKLSSQLFVGKNFNALFTTFYEDDKKLALFLALCNSNFKVTENSSTSFDRLWSYLEDAKVSFLFLFIFERKYFTWKILFVKEKCPRQLFRNWIFENLS